MPGKKHNSHRAKERLGSAMILVLLAVSIALVLGLTFLASSTTVTAISQTMDHHAQSRQIAESGLRMAFSYVQQTPGWRQARTSGAWVNNLSVFDGTVLITGNFADDSAFVSMEIADSSFEQEAAQLPTPLLAPPMSGAIGGWLAQRTAAVVTGPTVPTIGVVASANATQGSKQAFMNFGAAVNGSGTFSQTLGVSLEPRMLYELSVDVKTTGFPPLSSNIWLRLLAGNTVVASSQHASTLQLPAPPQQLPAPPSQPPTSPEVNSVLDVLGLTGGYSKYTLRFITDNNPAAGALRVELFANSTGLASEVDFDNVRLRKAPNDPLTLTVVGRHGQASYEISASVATSFNADGSPNAKLVRWTEP